MYDITFPCIWSMYMYCVCDSLQLLFSLSLTLVTYVLMCISDWRPAYVCACVRVCERESERVQLCCIRKCTCAHTHTIHPFAACAP